MSNNTVLLTDLARVTAHFQLRAIAAHMGLPMPAPGATSLSVAVACPTVTATSPGDDGRNTSSPGVS